MVRMRNDWLRSVAGKVQNMIGDWHIRLSHGNGAQHCLFIQPFFVKRRFRVLPLVYKPELLWCPYLNTITSSISLTTLLHFLCLSPQCFCCEREAFEANEEADRWWRVQSFWLSLNRCKFFSKRIIYHESLFIW